MIFNKEVHFPYPVISPYNDDYENCIFELDVNIIDLEDQYRFDIEYKLNSHFINSLLVNKKATIYIVIASKDTKFYELTTKHISIPKNRISLTKRTYVQLFIASTTRISMRDNSELHPFFVNTKDKIFIDPQNVLAISNIEKFTGDLRKPFDLFYQVVDESLSSDLKIELAPEVIKIILKDKAYQYTDFPQYKSTLNHHYIYLGLQKALMQMIVDLNKDDLELDIEEMDEPENKLYYKLYNLMKKKNVSDISLENIDDVIHKISDRIIDKHTTIIKRLCNYES